MQALEYPFDGEALLRKKRALRRELAAQPGLVEKKVAIVSGTTVGEVKNMLELFLLNSGIRPTFWEGPYGLYYESIAFDDGSLAAFAPDVIYIHTSVHNLQNLPVPADSAANVNEARKAERLPRYQFSIIWLSSHSSYLWAILLIEPPRNKIVSC